MFTLKEKRIKELQKSYRQKENKISQECLLKNDLIDHLKKVIEVKVY